MKKYLSINEVSYLLQIPKSTLRYWEEEGIFSIEKDTNNYRKYSIDDLVKIAEISFYRSNGIPIKHMKNFNLYTLNEYESMLSTVKENLEFNISEYTKMYNSLNNKINQFEMLKVLLHNEYIYINVPFQSIVEFDYSDRDKIILYSKNPSSYVRIIDSNDLDSEIRGISVKNIKKDDNIIWTKKSGTTYLSFLITEEPANNYKNNIAKKINVIQEKYMTGLILAQFLVSSQIDGIIVDYLQAYVEIKEQ